MQIFNKIVPFSPIHQSCSFCLNVLLFIIWLQHCNDTANQGLTGTRIAQKQFELSCCFPAITAEAVELKFILSRFILNLQTIYILMPKKQSIEDMGHLRFGQIIRIHGHKCLPSQEKETRGMITVKGFTDKDAKYTTFQYFKDCNFYRQSLFQIRPRGNFETKTSAQDYEKLVQDKLGDFVKFGDDVVFQHVDSHDYLTGSVRCSDGGLGAFKVETCYELSMNLVFKLQPFRSFEKEGDKIKLESPLRIKNIQNRCYISTQTKQTAAKILSHNIVTTYSRNYTWLIHLHQDYHTLKNTEQIRTHDLLFLIHTKNQGFLTLGVDEKPCIKLPQYKTGYPLFTSLWEIEKYPVLKISPYRKGQPQGTQGTYSLRQILNNNYLKISGIENSPEILQFDQHQITIKSAKGLPNIQDYLCDKGLIKIGGPKGLDAPDREIDAGEDTVPQKLRYRKKSPFTTNSIRLSDTEGEHGFRVMKIDEQSKNEVLFVLSTFQVLKDFDEKLNLPLQIFQKNIRFRQLIHIDQTLQKLIALIKNCKLEDIEAEMLPVKKLQYVCMQLTICKTIFSILAQIGSRILEQIYKTDKMQNQALKKVFNRAYYFIWQIIKGNSITKIYVCEDWFDIILDHAIQLQEDTVHSCLNEILQSNDQVVSQFLAEDNHKLVQRINTVFTLKPPHQRFLKIFSASCVSGSLPIVRNQTLILNQFLKKQEATQKFTFRYQLDYSGQHIQQNNLQMIEEIKPKIKKVYIYCYISKDRCDERTLKKFFQDSGRIDLYQTSNYFIAYLNLLADICYGKNNQAKKYVQTVLKPQPKRKYKYAISSQLQQEEDEVKMDIDIKDILVAILQDQQMKNSDVCGNINLQRAVLRLITFAYIQSSKQSPVLRINRYRNLDQMNNQIMGGKKQFLNIMQFIKNEITQFKSFYSNAGNQKESKQKEIQALQQKMRLYTILDLLKSTIINAFWTIEEQQNQILPLLLKILKNNKNDILHHKDDVDQLAQPKEFKLFKTQVSQPTPSVQKIIQCKALACQLIQIIFDFRFDSLVTQSVHFYKDSEQQKGQNLKNLHKISLDLTKLKSDAKSQLLYSVQLWQQKFSKIVNKQDKKFDQLKKAFELLIPLMVQLSIHKNSLLFFRSLRILQRHFYITTDIKNQLLSLSLFDNDSGRSLSQSIKSKRFLLSILQEEGKLYKDENIKEEDPYKEIVIFLAWLSECIKTGTKSERYIENPDVYYSIFEHFNEQSRVDKFHQRMIKNTDIHPLLIKFLGLSKQPLSEFNSFAKKALKYVYRFLSLLVKNFKEAKKEMIHMVKKIKTHAIQQGASIKAIYKQKDTSDNRFLALINFEGIGVEDKQAINMLQQRMDCEAISFLAQLYNDNKDILYDQTQMEDTTNEISKLINDVPIDDYYKSHILDFLRSLVYYKDKHISINQSRILAKLQDSKKQKIHYRFDKPEFNGLQGSMPEFNGLQEGRTIFNLIEEFNQQNKGLQLIEKPEEPWPVKNNSERPIIIMPQLTYFITLMNLFSNLVEGKQIVNIGKCRQVHSYSMLIKILSQANLCYPLKTHLRNYINELYYSTQIQQDLCMQIITLQLPLIIQDLNTLIVILSKTRTGRYRIMHPIRYKYLQSYIYLYIEQIAYTMNYLMSDQTFQIQIKKQLDLLYGKYRFYLHYYILRIYQRLRWVLNYYYGHKYLRGFLNKVTNQMKKVFLMQFNKNALNVFDKSQEKLHPSPNDNQKSQNTQKKQGKQGMSQNREQALKKRSKKLLHKLVQAQIGNYFTVDRPEMKKNFPLTFFLPYDQDQKTVEKQSTSFQKEEHQRKIAEKLRMMLFARDESKKRVDYHSLKLSKLNSQLHSKESFVLFMKNFIEKTSIQLYQVDEFSSKHYSFKTKFVSFQEYIQIFVFVNTKSPKEIPTQLKIFFFNILFQFIIRHNQKDKLKLIQNWNKYDIQDINKQIVDAQLFLKNSNVAELLIETLKNTDDLILTMSILEFGIAYLLNGNKECQNSILELVKNDKKNGLFIKIQKIIYKLGKKISSKIEEVTKTVIPRSHEFVVQSIDRYDYYDHQTHALKRFGNFQEERDEIEQQRLQRRVFGCLFKFMQLLCQCNNISFKDFIRQQIDTNGEKKNSSINILNMTTFEIRRLFKVMNKDASIIILPLTDFLNEVVSLPCSQNQKALCETTFFEDLCYMGTFFNMDENLKERGFQIRESLERLFQLYKNCILIILNILEGNNSELQQKFLNKLDVMFLLRIIIKNFQYLNVKNVQDLKRLLYDKNVQQKHVPLYLQNAINVMIVLLKLQANPKSAAFQEKKRMAIIELTRNTNPPFPLEQLLKSLTSEILKIEIVSTLGKQYLYFPKHPILTKLSDATRNRIMQQVSRSTQRQKIKSLLTFKEQIFTEIRHNFQTEKQTFLGLNVTPLKIQQLQNIMFNLSYIIILIWFITTDVIVQFQQVDYLTPKYLAPVLKGLDVIQLTITILYFILYYKCKFVLAHYRAKKEKEALKQEEERVHAFIDKKNSKEEKPPLTLFRVMGSITSYIADSGLVVLIKFDQKFLNVLFYFLASFFGTFWDQKLFMLYILYYFMMNQSLQNVFKAITFNLKSLSSVGLLGAVFVYIFCLIFYQTYALQMASKSSSSSCDTIVDCIFDLYVSGAIGGSVQKLQPMRFSTDLVYFIFFQLLFSNIVSGIMIDTFAELRAKREEMSDDKKNKCYICGNSRADLQKLNDNFENHINTKHFLWNYIYYLYYLQNKNETEYTGLQYEIRVYVNKGPNSEDYFSWIPFGGDQTNPDVEKAQDLISLMQKLQITKKEKISKLQSAEETPQA